MRKAMCPENSVLDAAVFRTRLEIASGTREVSKQFDADFADYDPRAVVPLNNWRKLSDDEWVKFQNSSGMRVILLDCRTSAVVALSGRFHLNQQASRHARVGSPSKADIHQILDEIRRRSALQIMAATSLGVYSAPCGLTTITVDPRSGRRIGLHVDNLSRLPAHSRAQGPSRLCINIGTEPRYFLFSAEDWHPINSDEGVNRSLDRNFSFTDYCRHLLFERGILIYRLQIKPFEAYIAPTDSMIHDASTLGAISSDTSLVVVGYFQAC